MNNEAKYNECIRLLNQAIRLLDESYDKARKSVHIDWWVYDTPLERSKGFADFVDQCHPSGKVRHMQRDVTFGDDFMVKFVTIDDIMLGVEFTDMDNIYLKSPFTHDSAMRILSRMRGVEHA